MKRFIGVICLCILPFCSLAQVGSSVVKTLSENALQRKMYAAARRQIVLQELKNIAPYSIAQVHRPGNDNVLGTAWITKQEGKYWAVMPYHIGGKKGSMREVMFQDMHKRIHRVPVQIAVNGNAGFHSPDVALAEIPAEETKDIVALDVAEPDESKPIYSFGYTHGMFTLKDWLPVTRKLFSIEGFGLMANREIAGETEGNSWNLSGYCGSPLIQQFGNEWKVVGMHAGSAANPSGHIAQNLSFAIHIPRAFKMLFNELNNRPVSIRPLLYEDKLITSLFHRERVKTVEIVRNNEVIFTQELRNFAHPYSDAHAENAFVFGPLVEKGDILRFSILDDKHQIRRVEFKY